VGLQSNSPSGLKVQKPRSESIHSLESNLPSTLIMPFNLEIRVKFVSTPCKITFRETRLVALQRGFRQLIGSTHFP
jgi:hypothetical protein